MTKHLKKWLGLGFSLFVVNAQAAPSVTQIQVLKFPTYSRIIFQLDESGESHVFALGHPSRVVVDLQNARVHTELSHVDVSHTNIQGLRVGWPKPNTVRFVFDLNSRARYKSFFVPDKLGHGAQLIVDIFSEDQVKEVKEETPIAKQTPQPEKVTALKDVKPEPVRAITKPVVMTRKKPALDANAIAKPHTVVIAVDAGHGGKDPGTKGVKGSNEKDIVLGIAIRMANLINKEPNMRAVLTRNGDYFVTLRDRLRLARSEKADLFVSVHADAFLNDQSTGGVSIYALSHHGATSEAARWLASRENYSELGGVDFGELGDKSYVLRSVLIDLAQTATIKDSLRLGLNILKAVEPVAKLHDPNVEQAPFVVLKSPDIPSVLIESGYLSNPHDETHLCDPEYREKLAVAFVTGVKNYLKKHPVVGV